MKPIVEHNKRLACGCKALWHFWIGSARVHVRARRRLAKAVECAGALMVRLVPEVDGYALVRKQYGFAGEKSLTKEAGGGIGLAL